MSEEAPVTEVTPEVVETASTAEAPVSGEATPEAKPVEKTFTQDELNSIVAKEKAKVERKAQRDFDRRVAEARQPVTVEAPAKPTADQYQTTEDYVEALAGWKAEEIVSRRVSEAQRQGQEAQQQRQLAEIEDAFSERCDEVRGKHDDYDDVVGNPALHITPAMAATIKQSETGPELAYYLGKNPQEATRIAKLSPFLQAKELGRLEVKVSEAPAPKTSAAPEPIKPVNGRVGNTALDTTDPKSLGKLGTSAWIEADRQRLIKKWEQQNR